LPNIEKTAIDFAKRVEAIKNATVDYVYDLGGNLSRQELAVLVGQLDFTAIVNELGFVSDVDKLVGRYADVLRGIDPISPLNEDLLQALVNSDRAFYMSKGGELAGSMQREMARGAILGATRQGMKEVFKELDGLRPDQVQTLVDTSMRVFGREVNLAMTEEFPDDTLYVYVGPADEKTRDICLAQISAGEMTQSEIIQEFGSAVLTDGGGYNCRHEWRLSTTAGARMAKKNQAKVEKLASS
jgi:hypothetical protein